MRRGGIILTGGHSRRMGTDKSSLPFQGKTFLTCVIATLRQAAMPLWIVLGKESPPPADLGANIELVRDKEADIGPLEGLRCGLTAARADADWLFVTSCDAPLLRLPFVEYLFQRCEMDDDVVTPWQDGHFQPLGAVYHTRVIPHIESQVCAREFSLQALLRTVRTRAIPVEELRNVDATLDSLRNLNTPADYARLLAESIRRAAPFNSSKETE